MGSHWWIRYVTWCEFDQNSNDVDWCFTGIHFLDADELVFKRV